MLSLCCVPLFYKFDLHGTIDYIKGMQVYYNYIRGHQGLDGKTPTEMAHILIDLTGNRWQTMIELANQRKCEGC